MQNETISYSNYINLYHQIKDSSLIEIGNLKKQNIAILRSFTCEQIEAILKVECFNEGFYANIFIGGYNQYAQEILDTTSELYKFQPDLIILAIRLEELYPELFSNFLSIKHDIRSIENYIIETIENLIVNIKAKTNANIFIHNFVIPIVNYSSLYDFQNIDGQVNVIRRLNLMLPEMVNKYSGVYIVDVENLCSITGKQNLHDQKMWYVAKNPFKMAFYISLAKEYVKFLKAIYGFKKKCVVLDLDNTLWGGIVGEDGMEGIRLGDSYPGNCYKEFQKELLKLTYRGIVLAINSKNNYDDAIEVIREHPDMVLREKDFVSIKINWKDKATNLLEIANELNIGLDSMVFIDDNPAECELINQKLPDVTVINLPPNPIEYAQLINESNLFETIKITLEDLSKTNIYKAQIEREKLKNVIGNLEDYYKSLEMVAIIKPVNIFILPRIAQLTQKTNQFNLTTKRYTEKDIEAMSESGRFLIYSIEVADRFGDNGIVGTCILHKISPEDWYIDTFLLSCRVMNRTIENAFMAFIYEQAKKNNVKRLVGEYIPTKKNKPVEYFYTTLGFKKIQEKYMLEIQKQTLDYPGYIKVIFKKEGLAAS